MFSLSFDSRTNHFCVIKQRVSLLFFTHALLYEFVYFSSITEKNTVNPKNLLILEQISTKLFRIYTVLFAYISNENFSLSMFIDAIF